MSPAIEPNERIPLRVLFEDEHLLIVNKPAGLVTQPGKGHARDTLLNAAWARHGGSMSRLGTSRDHGLLHRLDKDASGVLILGLSAEGYDAVRALFAARRVRKFYWAITRRAPAAPSGYIRRPIREVRGEQKLAQVTSAGDGAVTAYRLVERSALATLIEASPITGRLHQIRVHLASIGCPIVGDPFYASRTLAEAFHRTALHAHRVRFTHPVTHAEIDVAAPMPKDLRALCRRLGLSIPTASVPGSEQDAHEGAGDAVGQEEAGASEPPASALGDEVP